MHDEFRSNQNCPRELQPWTKELRKYLVFIFRLTCGEKNNW